MGLSAILLGGLITFISPQLLTNSDSTSRWRRDTPLEKQRDLLDVARRLLSFLPLKHADSTLLPIGRTFLWVVPEAGYSPSHGRDFRAVSIFGYCAEPVVRRANQFAQSRPVLLCQSGTADQPKGSPQRQHLRTDSAGCPKVSLFPLPLRQHAGVMGFWRIHSRQ